MHEKRFPIVVDSAQDKKLGRAELISIMHLCNALNYMKHIKTSDKIHMK